MIVMENWSFSTVVNEWYRMKLKHTHSFVKTTVHEVLLAMTFLVEQKLAGEMKKARCGSIVHDRWAKFGIHYRALFAIYSAKQEEFCDGVLASELKMVISLLSVSPLIELVDNIDDDVDDNNEFVNFINDTDKMLGNLLHLLLKFMQIILRIFHPHFMVLM
jgi:hypothetical protein